MTHSQDKQGELFVLSQAFLWGLFPVLTIISYARISPLLSLCGSIFFATLFFAGVITVKKKWTEVKSGNALPDILFGTLFLGVLYYLLSFIGLRYTTAGNASIIALTEVFFSFLFFHVWQKDRMPLQHIFGAFLVVMAAVIVLSPHLGTFQVGDILIIIASAIAPIGNHFFRRARKTVSSEVMMFIRSIVSFSVVLVLVLATHTPINFAMVFERNTVFFWIVNGMLLLGLSKILWIEGIHRINVTKANALASIAPLFTMFFAWVFLKNAPTTWQLFSFVPMFFGIVFLNLNTKKSEEL